LQTARAELHEARSALAEHQRTLGALRERRASIEQDLDAERQATEHARARLAARELEVADLRERLRQQETRGPAPARPQHPRRWPPGCSVVIPVFDTAALTRACLDALLDDPRENVDFEVIVVDDASTDSTPELLASYGDRIHVVTNAANAGFAASCN